MLTVQSFGWNTSGLARQKALLGSSSARLNLARQIAAASAIAAPTASTSTSSPSPSGADTEFTALVRTIRTELNQVHRGYQITFDTTGSIGNYPIAAATASGGADAIFIMGYDYRTGGSSPVGSVAPLGRNGYDIRDTIAAYLARVPASKLILGVPYYGRAWSTNSSPSTRRTPAARRPARRRPSTTTPRPTTSRQYGRHYDAGEGVAWTAYRRRTAPRRTAASPRGASSTSTTRPRSRRNTTSSTPTGCAEQGSGRSAMTAPGPSCGPRSSAIRDRHDAADGRRPDLPARPAQPGLHRALDRPGRRGGHEL